MRKIINCKEAFRNYRKLVSMGLGQVETMQFYLFWQKIFQLAWDSETNSKFCLLLFQHYLLITTLLTKTFQQKFSIVRNSVFKVTMSNSSLIQCKNTKEFLLVCLPLVKIKPICLYPSELSKRNKIFSQISSLRFENREKEILNYTCSRYTLFLSGKNGLR